MKPLRINLLAFDSAVMKSEIPVLLVFGAVWDNKSRKLFDSLDRLGEEYDKIVKFGKVDYDYVPDIFHDMEVFDIPTIMMIEDGKVFERKLASDSRDIKKMLDHFFGVLPY